MSRLLTRIVPGMSLVAVAAVWAMAPVAGQGGGPPATSRGEWPHYTADVRGTRYSPLDQINARQLQQARSGVALQDRQPRAAIPSTSSKARR